MRNKIWDLSHLFNSDHDPSMEKKRTVVKQKSYEFINRWKNRTDYLNNPTVLRQALDEYERWIRLYGTDGDEGYYFWLRTTQDQNNPDLKAKFNKIDEFSKNIGNDIRFFYLRLSKIPRKRQNLFLNHPSLSKYKHYLERIFIESRYILSEPEEKILYLKSTPAHSNWTKMTSSFLAKEERSVFVGKGEKAKLSFSELLSLMNSKKKIVRDSSAKAFNSILKKHADVAESELNAILSNKKIDDDLRKIPRPDLSRHISDDIDTDIVDTLNQSIMKRFDISRRYYTLKAKLMKVKKLRYHDRNVEYGDTTKKYTFHESLKLIRKVLRNLDNNFVEILDNFIENDNFDVFPRKGKSGGAFCAHHLISQPTYILLNHTDRLQDVLTLAHEIGHGINNELIKKKQHALYFGTPLSTAEVASTFMEDFVLQEILKNADDKLKLSIMMMKLNDDISTIFRQVACYAFEQELHSEYREKGYLSKEEIGKLFRKHMSAYMGKSVEQSRGSENWWVYWGHIRSFFYVYSYASGLLISKSLQNSVKKDPRFISKVKSFLSIGLSESPKNSFKKLGIDIADKSFWNKGLDEIETLLENTASLAKDLGKI
jgi:oligoendopeptidase F